MNRLFNWIKNHKLESLLVFAVLLIALFSRIYKIDQYMTFLGDEGRDVLIVRRFVRDFDVMLVGPGTSIGNMYLGPLYYYMMAPFLWLFNYSPVGPAVMVAILSTATVLLIYKISKEWFGVLPAFVASILYSISPTVIVYSRSSWNPNIMPFFALICIYSIWKFWYEKKYRYLIIGGASMAFVLNSHYLGLSIQGVFWIFIMLSLISLFRKHLTSRNLLKAIRATIVSKDFKRFMIYSFLGGLLFLILMSPLVIFDARHEFRNFKAINTFFSNRQETVSIKPWGALPEVIPLLNKTNERLISGYNQIGSQIITLIFLFLAFALILKTRFSLDNKRRSAIFLLLVWIFVSMISLALYKQEIYDHYYGFFFPAPFLLLSAFFSVLSRYKLRSALPLLSLFVFLLITNLANHPLNYPPNNQLGRTIEVSEYIKNNSNNLPYNFAVVAERNYEGAYQYFLEDDKNFKVIDPLNLKETLTRQLFVVCELPKQKCNPINNPKAEIANFGWSKIDSTYEVAGTTIIKLTPTNR